MKIALIGYGSVGRWHAIDIKNANDAGITALKLKGIYDIDPERIRLAKENNIEMPSAQLELLAERFALERGSRSARLAKQFIDNLLSK